VEVLHASTVSRQRGRHRRTRTGGTLAGDLPNLLGHGPESNVNPTAETARSPEAITFHRSYPGADDQVRRVRADLAALVEGAPVADELVLLASELCTNAIVHSRSGLPGGLFTVRAEIRPDDFAWLEVEDQGGPWVEREPDEEHGRGLALVAALAGDGNWTVEDGSTPGTRVVWVRLDWAAQ
jgi:serine/threonine-protein kinase RsbW